MPGTQGLRGDTGAGSNVVQFPRDWIGPTEDLVPFGPSAEKDADDLGAALGASAFWGEDSASLQQAVAGPGFVSTDPGVAWRQSRLRIKPLAATAGVAAVCAIALAVVSLVAGTGARRSAGLIAHAYTHARERHLATHVATPHDPPRHAARRHPRARRPAVRPHSSATVATSPTPVTYSPPATTSALPASAHHSGPVGAGAPFGPGSLN